MLSPDGPLRQRNHFKSFCRHISLYESLHVAMREQQRRNWRHGSAAESGVGSACRPPQRSGRTVRKSAVWVKVSADGLGLLTLAVPGNQKTARGGLGGDFYGPPAHGLGRCRADRNPRGGKGVNLTFEPANARANQIQTAPLVRLTVQRRGRPTSRRTSASRSAEPGTYIHAPKAYIYIVVQPKLLTS